MNIFHSLKVSSSALKAQMIRLSTISSNLANMETTRTPDGGPYKKKSVVFQPVTTSPFSKQLDRQMSSAVKGVEVSEIVTDKRPPKMVYDPSHPDAGDDGFVAKPNVNMMEEIADMMSATRAYEVNVTVIKSAKQMALKALQIGK
jgi:flagellar basal-body rod protein FlgC